MNAAEATRYCAFCGLPISSSFGLGRGRTQDEIDYCCSGCRTVANVEQAKGEQGASASNLTRLGLAIFFTMNVMVFTMALWSQDIYPEQSFATELAGTLRSVFRWASLIFSLPVLWLLGGPIAQGVWSALRRKAITTDLLMLLGVSAAYGYSLVSVLRGEGHVYFEVGSMVLVFVSLGRWLEAKGKRRTGESLDALLDLLPATVRRLNPAGNFQEISRAEVVTGDVLRVLPGERFPVDGRIILGEAHVDQQMVTGESMHAAMSVGDTICSGTLNVDGDLRVEVSAADGSETVSRLIEMVRTARSVKGRHELLADRVATWFVPTVCVIAVIAGWVQGQAAGIDQGILTGLAVVLIACPCALGLATPMAIWTALGRAAECGVLFRSGRVIQSLASIRFACFDKTGTLTTGNPLIRKVLVSNEQDEDQLIRIAASISAGSTHPLSQAIVEFSKQRPEGSVAATGLSVDTIAGKGLRSEVPEYGTVFVGNQRLMEEAGLSLPPDLFTELAEVELMQQISVGWGGLVRGVFCAAEFSREEAEEAIAACRQLGLELQLLTGDHALRAEAISEQLAMLVKSGQLPGDKVAAIESLAKRGDVAMVGDGLNDAPALAAATVGVALGCGADVSRDAAGVCLLADDLRRFPWAVGLARKTIRIVKQNLFWAFTYNCLGIALAATGRLNPIWAALAMAVSSLLVVTNSLRLSHYSDNLQTSLAGSACEPEETIHSGLSKNSSALISDSEFVATSP